MIEKKISAEIPKNFFESWRDEDNSYRDELFSDIINNLGNEFDFDAYSFVKFEQDPDRLFLNLMEEIGVEEFDIFGRITRKKTVSKRAVLITVEPDAEKC